MFRTNIFLALISLSFSLPFPKYILSTPPVYSDISFVPISSLSSSIREGRVIIRSYPQCTRFCDHYYGVYPEACYEICSQHFSSDGGVSDETIKTTEPATTISTTTIAGEISTTTFQAKSPGGRFTPACPAMPIPAYVGSCLTSEELKLYDLINQYRAEKILPALPLSKTLSTVAQLHAVDSDINYPNPGGSCNLHSWSDSCPGGWDGMCYTGDHSNAMFMWSKPNEINSGFQGNGYEISAWYSAGHTAEMAIDGWKKSSGHNALLIEDGWGPFGGIGIGLYGNYAHVWFAKESDPDAIGNC